MLANRTDLANLASARVAAALFRPRHLWKHCWIHSTLLNSFSAHRNPRWYAVWFSFREWEKSLPELKVRKLPESLMQSQDLLSPKLKTLKTFGGEYSVRTHNPGPRTLKGEVETSRSSIDNDLWRPKSPWWPHVTPSQAYLAFSFNDDDWYSSGRPAVFGW